MTWKIFRGSTPAFFSKAHGLADYRHIDGDDAQVRQFGDLPGPGVAHQYDVPSHGFQNAEAAFENRFISSAHDRQRAGFRFFLASADRCVEHGGAFFPEFRGYPYRRDRVDRAGVDADTPLADGLENAMFPQVDLLHLGRARQHGDDHVAFGRHLGRFPQHPDALAAAVKGIREQFSKHAP